MPPPRKRRGRRVFSFRVFIALLVFAGAAAAGFMTAFGPQSLLGPRPEAFRDSLLSAVRTDTGDPVDVQLHPPSLGPGMLFQLKIPIESGLAGHLRINAIEVHPEHDAWPSRRFPQFVDSAWGAYIEETETRTLLVEFVGLGVPASPALAGAEVPVRLRLVGARPMLEDGFLVNKTLETEYVLVLKLGQGTIEPTGILNFDLYNRWTTGMLFVVCLLIASLLLRQDISPVIDRPEDMLPEMGRRR